MTAFELRETLTRWLLPSDLKQPGQILYSGIDTLKCGEFYFVGFNPAEDGTNPLLCKAQIHEEDWSAYTQQCWYCPLPTGCSKDCTKIGGKPHQKRVVCIMKELGLEPEKTFATNLIFVQSKTASEVYNLHLFDRCWCVHQRMLAEVRPKYVVCLGYGERLSAYSLLRGRARDPKERGIDPSKTFKSFTATFDGIPNLTTVIGLRHPSRWGTNTMWLRNFINRS